jgi:hypothetical protein
MRDRRALLTAAALVLAGLLVVALAWDRNVGPWLDAPREVTAGSGVPKPRFNLSYIDVPPRGVVCSRNVTVGPRAERLVVIAEAEPPTPPVRVSLTAGEPGAPPHRSRSTIRGGWGAGMPLLGELEPPPESARGEVCLRNLSRTRGVAFMSTAETDARPQTFVDGELVSGQDLSVQFTAAEPVPLGDRRGEVLERSVTFSWGVLGGWTAWLLAVLLVIGMPVAVLAALAGGVLGDRRAQRRDAPDSHSGDAVSAVRMEAGPDR